MLFFERERISQLGWQTSVAHNASVWRCHLLAPTAQREEKGI